MVWRLSPQVKEQSAALGLSFVDLTERIRCKAKYSHPPFNWRHRDLLFQIDGQDVISLCSEDNEAEAVATNCTALVEDECPVCNNDGGACAECNTTGKLKLTQSEWNDLRSTLV